MKLKIILLLLLILGINISFCPKTSAQSSDYFINPLWEYYSTNILSSISAGKGNTGVASSGDVGLIYLNPATLNIDKKFQVNAGYNLKSDANKRLNQNFYSFSIAGAYRLNKNFQVGFAYQNDYSYKYTQSSYIPEYEALTQTFETHSFRIPLVYNHRWLRIGANLNLIYFKSSSYGCLTENLWKLNPEIGAIITPIQEFSFGASFIPSFSGYPDIVNNCWGNETYTTIVKYPSRVKIGTEFRTSNNDTKFTFDYHFANTSSISYRKDRSDFHFGFEHLLDEQLTFRFGFFTMQKSDDDHIYFLSLGTSFKFNNYSFNLAGLFSMDDNSGRGEYYVLNFGAGYEF